MKLNHPEQIQFDTVLENCFFYVSSMYEFSHSLDPLQTKNPRRRLPCSRDAAASWRRERTRIPRSVSGMTSYMPPMLIFTIASEPGRLI